MDTLQIILSLIESNFDSDASFEIAVGLKPKTVYDWKREKSSSYLKMLPKLSEIFNVSTDYLLGNEQKNKPTAYFSDELIETIKDPATLEIVKLVNGLTPELREVALKQLDSLSKLSNK